MEIKRVIAGGLTALAAGATLALGAGAVTLGDFVSVTGNTMTSPYIVIGGSAAAEDTLAAADVGVALAGQATRTVAVPGAQGSMSVSNGALIEGESYKLYLGVAFNDANRKPDLTKDDLPVVLAGGTVDHKTISDVDYSEYISMGGQSVTWSKESEWEQAALNAKFDTSNVAYTYKIVFQSGLDIGYITGKGITLLGKDYVFSSQETELTNTSIVLYAAGQTETVPAGESTVVTVGGNDYTVTVVGVNTEGTAATIDVNGEAFDVDTTDNNYVTKGDLNVYIKSIRAFKFPAESGSVQIFIGSEKLTLDSANDRILTGENTEVTGATCNFTQVSEDKVYEIQITFTPDEDTFVQSGEALEDGIFGAFKIAFGGIYPELMADSKDLVDISKSSSTKVKVSFTNKAGDSCSMNVYYTTDEEWSDGSYDIAVSQPSSWDGTPLDDWNESGNISEKEYFLVNRGYDSYILKYVSTDTTNNVITLKDMCSGTSFEASTTTKFFYLGGQKYSFEIDTGDEIIRVDQTGGTAGEQVPLYTEHKAKIELVAAEAGNFTVTEAPYSVAGIQGAEEDVLDIVTTLSAGEVDTLDVINDTTAMAGTGGLISKDDTDFEYGVTESGTYVVRNSDSDTLKIYTPEVPTPVFVAVGADPSFTAGEGVTGGTVQEAVMIKNSISKMESEISTASLDRDVVLIGGPCANSLVAEVLNMSASKPQCSADFTAEYPTEGVIKVVSDAFDSGKKALVVAGVDRAATRDLAVKVMQGTVDYSA
jgi:hypothetical protein